MRVGEKVVADPDSPIDDYMRQHCRVSSNLDIFVDHDVRANVRSLADSRGAMNHCCGMNAWDILRSWMKQSDGAGEAQIRILATQHRGREGGEVFGDDHDGCIRIPGRGRILWVGYKRKLAGASLFNSSDACDLGIRCAIFQSYAKGGSNLCKSHSSVNKGETDCN